jgi:hypothetical protein
MSYPNIFSSSSMQGGFVISSDSKVSLTGFRRNVFSDMPLPFNVVGIAGGAAHFLYF